MNCALSGFMYISRSSPILIPIFKRIDAFDNKYYQMIQNRTGGIEEFKEINTEGFDVARPYSVYPENFDSELYQAGSLGVFPIARKNGDEVHVVPWDEVMSFWDHNCADLAGQFSDYYVRRQFGEDQNVVGLFPHKSNSLQAWRRSEYIHSRRIDLIWSKLNRKYGKSVTETLDPADILREFDAVTDMIIWLDDNVGEERSDEVYFRWRVIFRHVWKNYGKAEQEIAADLASKQLMSLRLDHQLYKPIFDLVRRRTDRKEFSDLLETVMDQLESNSHKTAPMHEIKEQEKYYDIIKLKMHLATKLLDAQFGVPISDSITGDDLFWAVYNLFSVEAAEVAAPISRTVAPATYQRVSVGGGEGTLRYKKTLLRLVNVLVAALPDSERHPELWLQTVVFISRAIYVIDQWFSGLGLRRAVRAYIKISLLDGADRKHSSERLTGMTLSDFATSLSRGKISDKTIRSLKLKWPSPILDLADTPHHSATQNPPH